MKRLPLLLDEKASLPVRAATYLFVPIVLVVALPFLFLLILVLYLAALWHGARVFVYVFTGSPASSEPERQKPHFLEMRKSVEKQDAQG